MLRYTYDLESTVDVFTNCMMADGKLVFCLYGNEKFAVANQQFIQQQLEKFSKKSVYKENFKTQPEYLVRIYHPNDSLLMHDLSAMIQGRDIFTGEKCEYCGWNSARYDLTLICMIAALLSAHTNATPALIKKCSDFIIQYEGYDSRLHYDFADAFKNDVSLSMQKSIAKALLQRRQVAIGSGAHIDWAKIAKSDETGEASQYPPALKKEMAKFGLDIVIDEDVSLRNDNAWPIEKIEELIQYNCNDVVGTYAISKNSVMQAGLKTRDTLREMYPYTKPAIDLSAKYLPYERDATAANLAGLVLIGPNRIKPADIPAVQYMFPFPDGSVCDLLEYMHSHEEFMHDDLYTFFAHFRGKDTRLSKQMYQVTRQQPITHASTMNCPYYRDGQPLDAYIRVSTGGAHGSVMAGLHKFTPDEVKKWIRSDVGALPNEKPTIDLKNVLHADWSSFYPVMASKLQMYRTQDKVDRYTGIIEHRFKIKHSLPKNKLDWAEKEYKDYETEMGLKFVLNNATGAGNMHRKYALLPVDNKTLSMRLIGNMLIWALAQRLSQKGAFILSTNTDGIYFYGIEYKLAKKIVDEYVEEYGMGVDPEIVERFINRDTSNRIELRNNKVVDIRGRLRHGMNLFYNDHTLGANVPYPLIAAYAAIEYMKQDDWLTEPYDRHKLYDIISKVRDTYEDISPWYQIHVGSGSRRLTSDGEFLQRINRVLLTTDGHDIEMRSYRNLAQSDIFKVWQYAQKNHSIQDFAFNDGCDTNFGDSLTATDDLKDLRFFAKVKTSYDSYYVVVECEQTFHTFEEFKSFLKKTHAAYIGFQTDNEPRIVSRWKPGKMTGYPSTRGVICNTFDELKTFDKSTLDLDAYTDWAEDLLLSWKITADLPEVGMKYVDEANSSKTSSSKRNQAKTKPEKKQAQDMSKTTLYMRNAIDKLYNMKIDI